MNGTYCHDNQVTNLLCQRFGEQRMQHSCEDAESGSDLMERYFGIEMLQTLLTNTI